MALTKIYDIRDHTWHNNNTPALNETNLNALSQAVSDIDDRVIELGADVLETVPLILAKYADIEALSENPPYIGANGNWWTWDTDTGEYVDSGIDASITVVIADVTALEPDANPYVTNTGTDTDPIFHLFIPRGQNGATGKGIASIAKTGTSGLIDTYTITFTDGTTTTFTVTNGRDGQGSGDMTQADYDADSAVKNAGGIKAYGDENYKGINDHDAWPDVTDKPFNTINNGSFSVSSGDLRLSGNRVSSVSRYANDGSATSAGYRGVTANYTTPTGSSGTSNAVVEYVMKQTATAASYTFTNSTAITSDRLIDVYSSIYGENPTSVTQNGSTVTVTFAESKARTVAIVLK